MGDPPQDPKGDAEPVAAATPTAAAPASPTPAAPPSFVGQNLKSAKSAASKAGYDATSHDASDKSAGRDRRRLHRRLVLVRRLFLQRRLLLGRLGQCPLRELRSGPGRRQGTPPPGGPGYSRKLDRDGDGTACE